VLRFRALAAFVLLLPAACVSRVHYEQCVSDAAQAKAQADAKAAQADAKAKDDADRIASLTSDLAAAQALVQDHETKLSDLSTSSHNIQTQLDEATAINQQLRAELSRLGKDVDKMLSERGTLSKALDDAKSRLEELRKAQAAARVRIDLFRELGARFKTLVDAGQMRIEMRRGLPVMEIAGDLLFDSGKSELRAAGKGSLMEVVRALQTMPAAAGRRFLVASFVDVPESKTKGAKGPWELTSARSVAVVEYLASLGVPAPQLLAAAGGSFDPVAANDSAANRALNRRVELTPLPVESELVAPPAP
jgi:chemotaxis protein MotB